ncbi:MAG: aspartate/glutamate racemase family protein [Nitrososphaeria archaeon]|nr:aspartate/glutamate racemase family protein [Nitrososphaeria archaeon]
MTRVGLIVPSSNTTMEPEFCEALRGLASVHTARVLLEHVNVAELETMEDEALREARKLTTAEVDLIVYGCTSGSFVKGGKQYLEIEERIEEETGIPCVATSGAVVRALKHVGAKRVSLITPYIREITELEKSFLEANGFVTVNAYYASIIKNTEIGRIPDEEVVKWTASNVSLDSDAVFISCTNLKMFRALRAIEERTGKPVVSSNSATLWNVLQRLKLQVSLPHLGKLLT